MVAVLLLTPVVLWFALTSSHPLVPERAAPTAEQVGAGRDVYRQLIIGGKRPGVVLVLGPAQLDGLGALVSHAFRPDALTMQVRGDALRLAGTHRLPLGRWLNMSATAEAQRAGFPRMRITIGTVTLPPLVSRWAMQLGRFLLNLRGANIPPLDQIVQQLSVAGGTATLTASPEASWALVNRTAGVVEVSVNAEDVVSAYCSLTALQRRSPSGDFAEQVRRAFSLPVGGGSRADFNRATFIALGMLLVDQSVGDYANAPHDQVKRCAIPPVSTSIYYRTDWPLHWTLSAAIAAGGGVQLSEAFGEWKELADSLARQSRFALGDPSGFSMADLAADRAGFGTARAAVQPDRSEEIARRLSQAKPEQLIPQALVEREDGLTNADFIHRYGGLDDPRFKARAKEIDAMLEKTGLQ